MKTKWRTTNSDAETEGSVGLPGIQCETRQNRWKHSRNRFKPGFGICAPRRLLAAESAAPDLAGLAHIT